MMGTGKKSDLGRHGGNGSCRNRISAAARCLAAAMAAIMVCTLAFPAITVAAVCPLPEHQHTDECYVQLPGETRQELVCTPEWLGIHAHTSMCYGEAGQTICGYADYVVHTHEGRCFDEDGALRCQLSERGLHVHTPECYAYPDVHTHAEECYGENLGELICQVEETEGHRHSETCYDEEGTQTCQMEESDGHHHTEACFEHARTLICGNEETPEEALEPVLICTRQDTALHTHTQDCFDAAGAWACGMLQVSAHQHDDACFAGVSVEPPLTCTDMGEAHVHGPRCYGTWELTCGQEEHVHSSECTADTEELNEDLGNQDHTHTDSCYDEAGALICGQEEQVHAPDGEEAEEKPDEDMGNQDHTHTDSCYDEAGALICGQEEHPDPDDALPANALEQEQVDAVSAMIAALPDAQTLRAELDALEEDEDQRSRYEQTYAQYLEARAAYEALSEQQKQAVTGAEKLLELEQLFAVLIYADGDRGEIRESLDGDWAYITDFKMKLDSTTESGTAIRTGTQPWDEDDGPGNDSGPLNNSLRTYDTASYTLEFSTKLREEKANEDIGGIRQGRLFFEVILPCAKTQAQFEEADMSWLRTSQGISYEIAEVSYNGIPSQVLRGSYILTPSGANEAAIGASINEQIVVIRALNMHNGDTLQPLFTLWLEHNEVGDAAESNIPTAIVTGNGHVCQAEGHGAEAQNVVAPEVVISARPMLNIELTGVSANNTATGTFDFRTGGEDAPNAAVGTVSGRMNLYGILIEARGKSGQGMRGMELPDPGRPITFDLNISSSYQTLAGENRDSENYRYLFWAGSGNDTQKSINGRELITSYSNAMGVPYSMIDGSNSEEKNCSNSGVWTFTMDENDPSTIHVAVSGFSFGPHFPNTNASASSVSEARYYDRSSVGDSYWKIERAVFASGKAAFVQPFVNLASGETVQEEFGSGTFTTTLEDCNMAAYGEGGSMCDAQTVTDDDRIQTSTILQMPGTISGHIAYLEYGKSNSDALSEGCFQTDGDWSTAGSKITLKIGMTHSGADGDYRGAASDNLIKYYAKFFEPEKARPGKLTTTVLWGAKADGTDWIDDEEMKRATADDLIWYSDLSVLKSNGMLPIATLFESRQLLVANRQNLLYNYVDGTIKVDCRANEVYMIVRNSYAWRMMDVAEAAAAYCQKAASELTDGDYTEYLKNAMPSHASGAKYYAAGNDFAAGSFAAMKPFWWEDYFATTTYRSNGATVVNPVSGCAVAAPASYPGGVYTPGVNAYKYQDSCLVMGFKTSITKLTAQIEASTNVSKTDYDMNQNQRTVDYELNVRLTQSIREASDTGGISLKTTVYVEDTLPRELTYIPDSAYLGGNYTQDPLCQSPGVVAGGEKFSGGGHLSETITPNEDGTTTVRWSFPAEVRLNQEEWQAPIRFSCTIGTPGNEATDVKNGDEINNVAKVWADGDSWRGFSKANGNLAEFGIKVQKTSSLSLSKISDQLVAEKWDDLGFTMNVGSNSEGVRRNTIIVETLPYNGLYNSHFNGTLVTAAFAMALVDSRGTPLTDQPFTFYYTTEKDAAGKRGSFYTEQWTAWQKTNPEKTIQDWAASLNGWRKLTFEDSLTQTAGMQLYNAQDLPTGQQITAILAVGDIPANCTLKMHIDLRLPDGKAGDYLVNYLSQDKLSSYARSQIVTRSLEGLTWLDANADGLQDDGEQRLSGVKVSLLWLQSGNYVPFCVGATVKNPNGNGEPVEIETGKTLNVQTGESADYETGRYRFTDLPAGTYAVLFEDGTTPITNLVPSPCDAGGPAADNRDSDGEPVRDENGKLTGTRIEGIQLHPAKELTYGSEISRHHDSGFYPQRFELPQTGGSGTLRYTAGGIIFLLLASLLGWRQHRKKYIQ